ncbi:chemotaxis protein CheW [Candidatus Methylospira mobilis]|uniref:Chemotaxis protein CheW n=1 Tax=Candidatus Methylospira mobilis TaxID=1808979 RepID=A0A5Q0BPV7_9GAMM|nr:chemotaxis protein CheW [Candidatus Methylospira mobilis]QFY44117.1 chemotaxis protein CheW [Candidatus Methylospira mobilis]WNV06474.1 chemotaxis protein CheW [Candidatus Methylospira mobilis]
MNQESSPLLPSHTNEYLTFTLGREEYGMPILNVQEIRGYDAVTRLVDTPEFIKGIVRLRGLIVPIIDMRIKFNLAKVEYNDLTVVIIIGVAGRIVGIAVDGVSDVIALGATQIKPAPEFDSSIDTNYVTGVGIVEDRILILVDLEELVMSRDMELVN